MITPRDGNVRPRGIAARPAKAASWAVALTFVAALVCLAPAATADFNYWDFKYWIDGTGHRGGVRPPVRHARQSTCRQFVLLCLCLPLLLAASPASAVLYGWWPGNGSFEDPTQWSPVGVPGPLDHATFLSAGASQVTFGISRQTTALSVADGDVTFLLGGHTYTVTQSSPVWPCSINVGWQAGYAGKLTLRNGTLAGQYVFIGNLANSRGTVVVDTGATWTNTGTLYLGYAGIGVLNVQNGGVLASQDGRIGLRPEGYGQATVAGAGSTWTTSIDLSVGYSGGGVLAVTGGGQVAMGGSGYVGAYTGSAGEVTVDGSGSKWTTTTDLHVGSYGTGTLAVTGGGQVATGGWGYVGANAGSAGEATVDGSGSKWTNTWLCVGNSGTGTLAATGGGQVSSDWGYVGYEAGSMGEVTVDGSGSKWTTTHSLDVGDYGAGALAVTNGGQVSSGSGDVGYWAGSTGEVTVDGNGSTWTTGDLCVGYRGTGTLAVTNGGQVSSDWGYVGREAGSTGEVTVDGNGSTWTNSISLNVGFSGAGTLAVTNGGEVMVGLIGGTLKLRPGGMLTVDGGTVTAGGLAGPVGAVVDLRDPEGGTALTVGSAASDTFSGTLRDDTGPGSLSKVGTGTQTLSGTGITYTGTTTVLEGILKLLNTTAFASDILNDATTEFEVTTGMWTFDEALGGAGTFVKSGDGTLVVAGPQDYDPGALWDVLGGAMVLDTDAGSEGADLSISVLGAELYFGCNQHLDTLSIGEGGKVVFSGANCVVLNHLVMDGLDLGATTMTPEPATLALVALGGLALLRRRRAA